MCSPSTKSNPDESLRHVTAMHPSGERLIGKQRNDFSQFGEDGLIESVFQRIGETNRWCFEVGAADGLFYSNTKRLRDAGWKAVLIEADKGQFAKLSALESDKVHAVNERINYGSLDKILGQFGAPDDIDLGVIDIDGQDYWAWDGMKAYRPRVMLIEYMYLNENFTNPAFVPPENGEGQAGLQAITELGKRKGYTPLVSTFCNVLFTRSDVWTA